MSCLRMIPAAAVSGWLVVLALVGLPQPGVSQTPQAVRSETTYGCLMCHAEKRRSFSTGTTWFVDLAGGNDANDGLSPETGLLTKQEALS